MAVAVVPGGGVGHATGGDAAGLFLQETLAEFELKRLGISLIDHVVQGGDPAAVIGDVGELGPVDDAVGQIGHDGAIEHEQGLLRHGGGEALAGGGVRAGEVKCLEHLVQVTPVDEGIHGAAVVCFAVVQVVRILDAISWVIIAGLLVGVGHDNVLVQCLQRPVIFHKIPGEIIEQFRMSRIHGA